MENRSSLEQFLKRGAMTLSLVCATLMMVGSTVVEAKGPLNVAVQKVTQNSLSEERINAVLKEAYEKFKDNQEGKNADYIKALAIVDSKIFGITLVTPDGKVYEIGDTKEVVSIQSISKVFTAAKVRTWRKISSREDRCECNRVGI